MPTEEIIQRFENLDLNTISTPVNVTALKKLLVKSNYDVEKTKKILDGFENGFDIQYEGPIDRQDTTPNIPFSIGNSTDMWNKVMKEVQMRRYAGPFDRPPFKNYIQSPLGLVPNTGGKM